MTTDVGENSGNLQRNESDRSFSPAVYPDIASLDQPQDTTIEMTENSNNEASKTGLSLTIPTMQNNQDDDYGDPDRNGGVHYRKHPRPFNNHIDSNGTKSPSAYGPRIWSYNRAISYQAPSQTHSVQSDMDHLIPPPSTDREKSKMTRRYFATVFALCYAIFLVIFGMVVFIGDAVVTQYPIGEAFGIYMLSVGFIYFISLYIDIRLHIKKAKETMKKREKRQMMFEEHLSKLQNETGPLELANSNANPVWDIEPVESVSHKYCFQTGRHGELFYLKLGAAWFCFGLLIHSALIVSYQVIFLTSTDPDFHKCASSLTLALDIMFPLYSLFVLFFIFKYANVIINHARGLARFFLMHAIGTSMAFWVYTIVRETVDAIRIKYLEAEREQALASNATDWISIEDAIKCPGPEELNNIFRNFSPYLYPFVIEFCILIAGIYYIIWANISQCPKKHSAAGHHDDPHDHHDQKHMGNGGISPMDIPKTPISADDSVSTYDHCVNHDINFKSHIVVHADCHSASRGLFAGMILIVMTIVIIILFFVAVNEDDYFELGITMNSSFELAVLILLIITVLMAYFQTAKLDVNTHPMSKLDDVLLFIAIPAFFLETIFSMVPAIYFGSVLNICIIIAQLIQILIQTPFIIDGMRRCSNSAVNRKNKPGRELITFLTIANVSLWIYYTFSVKTADTGDERYTFYGYTLWSILNHLSLPLIMFYRFHASVCLVDIWRHAYEPGGGH